MLVQTSDPGNIGATARAMKTMGVKDLRLVNPLHFPHPKAVWRSKAARDLVHNARVFTNLPDAIADCQLAVATSARSRALPWPVLSPRQLAAQVLALQQRGQDAGRAPVALIFGREKTGLSNQELQLCQWHCVIPTNPDYSVLNLSHAVQLICYELFSARQPELQQLDYQSDQPLATQHAVEHMFTEFCTMLDVSAFSHKGDVGKLIPRLRRFFARAQLDQMEVNIWHGIAAKVVRELRERDTKQQKKPEDADLQSLDAP